MGDAATREECIAMVKTREPTANGVTFPNRAGPANCYAEFGMTAIRPSQNWQTCPFKGRLIIYNLVASKEFIISRPKRAFYQSTHTF